MVATFGHPLWISSGVILMLVGFLLFRWARSINAAEEVSAATKEAAVAKILKGGQVRDAAASKKLATYNFRRAMSQLFGIIGFLLIIAGLMAVTLGIFYPIGAAA